MGVKRSKTVSGPKSEDILDAVEKMHGFPHLGSRAPRWATFREFRVGTGYGSRRHTISPEQRIDLFAMSCYPSDMFERVAYEVKVDRSDWCREIRDPYKRMAAYRMSNRFYFAVPEGLVVKDEVPLGCGLVVVKPDGVGWLAKKVLEAPYHESDAPTWMIVAAMARRSMDGR